MINASLYATFMFVVDDILVDCERKLRSDLRKVPQLVYDIVIGNQLVAK